MSSVLLIDKLCQGYFQLAENLGPENYVVRLKIRMLSPY
jgi:hypothetical protein